MEITTNKERSGWWRGREAKTDWCSKLNGLPPGGKSILNTYIVLLLSTFCLADNRKWLQPSFFNLNKQKK